MNNPLNFQVNFIFGQKTNQSEYMQSFSPPVRMKEWEEFLKQATRQSIDVALVVICFDK